MTGCKALFTVTAGVIPGTANPEHSKQWSYNSDDYEKDAHTPQDQPTVFSRMLQEAHDYAMGLSHPAYLNWVRVDWMWL